MGLLFFKSIIMRYQSLSNARWFYFKTYKIWKGNLYFTEKWLVEKFLDSNFNQAVINKILFCTKNCPKFHKPTKIVILKVLLERN